MEFHGGGSGGVIVSGSNVPAFLTKLWTLVEDPDADPLICWSPNGNSFHVFDQGRFSKEVLPKFFKHNNMASFVRQLNMYGFRKVVHIEHGGLLKPERDDTEFQHPDFLRGQEHLLENIKRKVTNVSSLKQEDLKISTDDVSKILTDVQHMRGKQENIDSKIIAMKHENEALWREVASLRQKHTHQQKVVNKLIQFLVTLVQSNRVLGMKRKIPLMLNDSSSAHSLPKFSRQYSLEPLEASPVISAPGSAFSAVNLFQTEAPLKSGPIISDITDQATPSPVEDNSDWLEDSSSSPRVLVKEEPSSPGGEEPCSAQEGLSADTPLSPTTLINSILQESEPGPAPAPDPTHTDQPCLSVACIDKLELNDHLDSIDNGLENLQTILNAQNINFDSSPLFEFFSSPMPNSDFDLDTSLDSIRDLLSPEPSRVGEPGEDSGKQLVQYTASPLVLPEPGDPEPESSVGDLPSLLQLEGDSYYIPDDPTFSLLSSDFQTPSPPQPGLS
ncbi:heat shock factor protein 1 isoform X3 [Hypomesus transpacificus]|uniref:heat shock factor protein 1 isoform X3 n=1 Tax=Hypomesus transpacificus TaxID=137520 RepID=UPI001F087F1C|nr:heat shock factor protein 1 isoform X3 [Hypomesus transpacificus]